MTPGFNRIAKLLVPALILTGGGCSAYGYVVETLTDSDPEPEFRTSGPSSYVVFDVRYHVMDSAEGYVERGLASWYGPKFHGKKTSSGEVFDMHQMSAAHKTLPLQTWVKVTHLDSGRSITVRVNDRGPFVKGRIIDLSHQAALALEMTGEGVAPVEVRAIRGPDTATRTAEHRFLQLGAFAIRSNAEAFVQKLRRQGLVRLSVQTRKRSTTLHRVLQGPFKDSAEFSQAVSRLETLGITEYTPVNIAHWKPIRKK